MRMVERSPYKLVVGAADRLSGAGVAADTEDRNRSTVDCAFVSTSLKPEWDYTYFRRDQL